MTVISSNCISHTHTHADRGRVQAKLTMDFWIPTYLIPGERADEACLRSGTEWPFGTLPRMLCCLVQILTCVGIYQNTGPNLSALGNLISPQLGNSSVYMMLKNGQVRLSKTHQAEI